METRKSRKKILSLGIILLVIAGLIVVSLKGFNVSLMFGKHEIIEVKMDSEIQLDLVNQICDEVFGDKKYLAKELEIFGDSFQINVNSLTDEEKANLVTKINEKFATQKTTEDLKISSVSNRRIRDVFTPYFVPMIISFAIILIYMVIRFKKIDGIKLIGKLILKVVLTEAILFSIIAIARIPVSDFIINIAMVIAGIELVWYISKLEKELIENKE